jgi:hypothetical protein
MDPSVVDLKKEVYSILMRVNTGIPVFVEKTPKEELYKGYVRPWYAPKIREPHGLEIEGRLKNMDEAGIVIQVLSLSKKANEELYKAINRHPGRFDGDVTACSQRHQYQKGKDNSESCFFKSIFVLKRDGNIAYQDPA